MIQPKNENVFIPSQEEHNHPPMPGRDHALALAADVKATIEHQGFESALKIVNQIIGKRVKSEGSPRKKIGAIRPGTSKMSRLQRSASLVKAAKATLAASSAGN